MNNHASLDTLSSVSASNSYTPPQNRTKNPRTPRYNPSNEAMTADGQSGNSTAEIRRSNNASDRSNHTPRNRPPRDQTLSSNDPSNQNQRENRGSNNRVPSTPSTPTTEPSTPTFSKSGPKGNQPRGPRGGYKGGAQNPSAQSTPEQQVDSALSTPIAVPDVVSIPEESSRFDIPMTAASQPRQTAPVTTNKFSSTNASSKAFISSVLPPVQANSNEVETPQSTPSHASSNNGGYYKGYGEKARTHGVLRALPLEEKKRQELELFGEARTGIDFSTYDDIPANASGKNCPEPIKAFSDIEFGTHLNSVLKLCGYERPTPIQKYSLPIAMGKRDMIACAQTGSGKTAAFLLPTIYQLFNSEIPQAPTPSAAPDSDGSRPSYASSRRVQAPQALILGPTRELVTQTYKEACKLTYMTTIRPVVVYGGVPIKDQIMQLNRGCHIIVATPGRLQDLCSRNNISLCNISILILDEADCMLDMGFAPQIEEIITKYQMPTVGRQTLMFSATFPAEIQRLAKTYLSDYVYVTIGRVGSSTSLVTQKLLHCPQLEEDKRRSLLELLDGCDGLTLIFVETKRSADQLEHFLTENEINAASIHGDRSQHEREQALSFFKSGHCPVLVATDVASRGLSIPNVEYVINYDMPTLIDDYVHRIGRTGRCGARGVATSFIGEKNRSLAADLLDNMREAKQQIPEFLTALVDSSRSSFGYTSSRYSSYKGKSGGSSSRFGANQDVRYSSGSSNPSSYTPMASSSSSSSSSTYTKTVGSSVSATYGNNSNSNDNKPAYNTYGVTSSGGSVKKTVLQAPVRTFSANAFQPATTTGNSALHGIQAQDDAW